MRDQGDPPREAGLAGLSRAERQKARGHGTERGGQARSRRTCEAMRGPDFKQKRLSWRGRRREGRRWVRLGENTAENVRPRGGDALLQLREHAGHLAAIHLGSDLGVSRGLESLHSQHAQGCRCCWGLDHTT